MSARPTNRYLCELCDATFAYPGRLKQHVDAVHLGLRPFVCSYDGCNAKFTEKGNLNTHVRSIHEGEEVRAARSKCVGATNRSNNKHAHNSLSATSAMPCSRRRAT